VIHLGHECYYCDQVFYSKEKLFDHLEVHSDINLNQQSKSSERVNKKLENSLKKDKSYIKKMSRENL